MNVNYRPEIDSLRAASVIAVILFHLEIFNVSGGFLGVDVFFVISGFLISNFITLRLSYICDISDKFTAFLINTKQNETIKIFDPFYRSMIHSHDFLKVIDLYVRDTYNMPKILNVCGQRCLSRVEYIKAFSDYINLNWIPVVMPNDFKINRPESIIMKSVHLQELISYTWANPGHGILQQLKK